MSVFSSLNLAPIVIQQLQKLSLTQPTPIQMQAIPIALAGDDILASSQTGSGKTIAFLAPLITHLMRAPENKGLILLPTREIALQVTEVLKQLVGSSKEIYSVLLMGGDPMAKQLMQLKKKPNLIIGTPGRICDHLDRKSLVLQDINFLVLDEVDRMLDMGFSKPLQRICKTLHPRRQTLMFSATLSPSMEKVAHQYLTNPKRISVTTRIQPPPKITQDVLRATSGEKMPLLLEHLDAQDGSILIFVKTKRRARDLALKLGKQHQGVGALHGDLPQNKRTRIMNSFRREQTRILVATDVAARGIDVPHINLVINYDLPVCAEDYIHRIGRTGRAGAMGRALSFIGPEEGAQWKAILRLMNPTEGAEPPAQKPAKKKSFSSKGKGHVKQEKTGGRSDRPFPSRKADPFHKKAERKNQESALSGGASRPFPKKGPKKDVASEAGKPKIPHKKPWYKNAENSKKGAASEAGKSTMPRKKPWHKNAAKGASPSAVSSHKKPWAKKSAMRRKSTNPSPRVSNLRASA